MSDIALVLAYNRVIFKPSQPSNRKRQYPSCCPSDYWCYLIDRRLWLTKTSINSCSRCAISPRTKMADARYAIAPKSHNAPIRFLIYESRSCCFTHRCSVQPIRNQTYTHQKYYSTTHTKFPPLFLSFVRRRSGVNTGDDSLEFETSKEVKVVNSFDAMNLKEELLRGIYQYGFEKPSAIQQRAILPIIKGRDVIAQAQSGTGKTSLIAITLSQIVDTSSSEYVL